MASGRQSDISADTSRSLEAGRIVNRCLKAERGDRADTRHGHEPSDLRIVTRQLQNLTVEIVDLLFNGLARREQRPDHSDQLGTVRDQFLGPHGKDIELGTADHETDVLEQAADLVLEITLDLDQQRPARQQRPNSVAIEVLDAHLLKPAGLHDAGNAGRIVAVTLIDLHLEYRLGMARVDADHRQAKLFELGPQPRACRSCLETDPYRAWRLRPHKRSDRGRVGINYAFSHDRSCPAHHTDRCLLQRYVQSHIAFHCCSPPLRGHMRMASCFPGELIACALLLHDPRITPCCKMLQKCRTYARLYETRTIAIPPEARKGNGREVASRRPSGPWRRRMLRGADGA